MSRALLALLALLFPHAARAESELSHQLWEVANLALLLVVLVYLARKPVLAYLDGRRDKIRGHIESAQEVLREARERLAEWSQRADRLEAEVKQIREAAYRAASQERDAVLAEARATAERIRQSASSVIERELFLAREALKAEVANLATELAARILEEKVDASDRSRLVDEFIERIEQGGTR